MMIVFWAGAAVAVAAGLALAATFIGTVDDPRHRPAGRGGAAGHPGKDGSDSAEGDRALPFRVAAGAAPAAPSSFWAEPGPHADAGTLTWLAHIREPERRGDADSPRAAAIPAVDDTISDPRLGGELWHLVQYALGCDTSEEWVERALAQTGLRREAYVQARRELAAGHG